MSRPSASRTPSRQFLQREIHRLEPRLRLALHRRRRLLRTQRLRCRLRLIRKLQSRVLRREPGGPLSWRNTSELLPETRNEDRTLPLVIGVRLQFPAERVQCLVRGPKLLLLLSGQLLIVLSALSHPLVPLAGQRALARVLLVDPS